MRKIGLFEKEKEADNFSYILKAQKIDCKIEASKEGTYCAWLLDEEKLQEARNIYQKFITNSQETNWIDSINKGKELAVTALKEEKEYLKKNKIRSFSNSGSGTLTYFMIITTVVFFLFDYLDRSGGVRSLLLISKFGASHRFGPYLYEVRSGELWRLISPIFFHAGILHLLFNLYWFYQLARPIEEQRSSRHFFTLILAIAIPSNLIFYFLAGPYFGGLSGLNYGLCAYLWFMGQHAPQFNYRIDDSIIQFFMIWYFICCGLSVLKILPVANTIHAIGWLAGFLFAYVASGRVSQLKMEVKHHPKSVGNWFMKGSGALALGILADLWSSYL